MVGCVVGEVGNRALHGQRPQPHCHGRRRHEFKLASRISRNHSFARDRCEICLQRLFAFLAAREGEIAIQHPLHLFDVFLGGADIVVLRRKREFKLQARQRRAQVMAHARKHGGALIGIAADTVAHAQQRARGLANFDGAGGLEIRHVLAATKSVGRPGELQDRAHLIAQEEVGRHQKQDAERHGPHDEDVRCDDDHALAVHARFQQAV